MIGVSAAMIPHRRLDLVRQGVNVGQQVLDARLAQVQTFDRLVQIGHVAAMVLRVVDLHGAGVEMRLQRIVRVGQIGQLEDHPSAAPAAFMTAIAVIIVAAWPPGKGREKQSPLSLLERGGGEGVRGPVTAMAP